MQKNMSERNAKISPGNNSLPYLYREIVKKRKYITQLCRQ